VTRFDLIVLGIFAVSAVIGLARGATRELTTMFALFASAVLALVARRFTAPIARHVIHAHWLADAAAVLVVFIALYIVLRLLGGMITRAVRGTVLSGPDRLGGVVVGAVRAWVVVGVLALLLDAVTPIERMPPWITGARTYPLVTAAAGSLRALAPQGMKIAKAALPAIGHSGDAS
jgi:membrane protein required for colicin V production